LREARPHKTVGSYWKYTSTLWDYIHRAMPFTRPESLSDDEVYAITAYVLYLNELVEDDFVLSQQNLAEVRLPNEANFSDEQRPDVNNTRCMENCRDPAAIEIISQAPQYEPPVIAASAAVVAVSTPGEDTYKQSCALCHDNGVGGSPVTGNAGDWASRISAGTESLYANAINGFQGEAGVMPAKGGFVQLSDDAVRQAVDYMVGASK
ncbi:MAG: c-type cytochrome, partial [Halieaceae bacterium]